MAKLNHGLSDIVPVNTFLDESIFREPRLDNSQICPVGAYLNLIVNEFGLCKSQGPNRKKVAHSDKIIEGTRRKPVCRKKRRWVYFLFKKKFFFKL